MKILKNFDDIQFNNMGDNLFVSEELVMASNAGWYIGAICKEDGFYQPYDRYSDYFATSEEAESYLKYLNRHEEEDGQPSWEQEWQDFGEVYDDDPQSL